ncbi:MAG TPA: hypothetical protein VM865_02340 [Acidobacteriaceae bacterium]|jgi:hypothetical protein|nr:hypothetical protein [Acidobacteriaceae bacterium]
MNDEQRKFLADRLRRAAREQPDLRKLKSLLLRFGGVFIVAPSDVDPDVEKLLEAGFVMTGPITMKKMKSSMCHQNVAAVWSARRSGMVGIATGYALSDDGLWRQHSWGLLRDGVLETTVPRVKYFGILLQTGEADHFAQCNVA